MEAGKIETWFFIRYWNGGPHIRLRVLTTDAYAKKFKRVIEEFMSLHPGLPSPRTQYEVDAQRTIKIGASVRGRAEATEPYQEEIEPFHEHNCAEERSYVFDSVRYGGPEAEDIVERHFYRASEIAAIILTRYSREDILSVALELLVACIFGPPNAGLGADKLIAAALRAYPLFFGAEPSLGGTDLETDDPQLHVEVRTLVNRWKSTTRSKDAEVPVLAGAWADEIAFVSAQMEKHGIIQLREHSKEMLILEFLHLMWNRLGVTLVEEWCLYRLIGSAIAESTQGKTEVPPDQPVREG